MTAAQPPKPIIKVVQLLFVLNAIIWSVFGAVSLNEIEPAASAPLNLHSIIPIFMFGNSTFFAISGLMIARRISWVYTPAVLGVAVNILLTFTDQVGFLDWLTAVIDIILLSLLIIKRKIIFQLTGTSEPE